MSAGIPQNLIVQTGNQQVLVSWDLVAGANQYLVERSQDQVNWTALPVVSGNPLPTQLLDTTVSLNTMYFYRVSASSDSGVTYSPPAYGTDNNPNWAIPVPFGENSLGRIRFEAQRRADRVNSNFVSKSEWNQYIEKAMYELYDIIIGTYEDYAAAIPIQFVSDGVTFWYPTPNGSLTFLNALNMTTFTPPPIYKLLGIDLALQNANNAYVTVNKFNFIDRNRFVYPNTASTIYGVFNLQYRLLGDKIMFIPTPTAGQGIRVWYAPRLKTMLADTDSTGFAISGWDEYVIVRAAKYALDKEEQDTSILTTELVALGERVTQMASNRDAGQPDKISDTRANNGWGSGNGGWNGAQGGF